MSDYYNSIVEQYRRSKELPFRLVEKYMYFTWVGDVTGKSILDLACGDGFYTRQFKQKGAKHVVGVDIAAKMIESAKLQETQQSSDIEYIVGDAAELGKIGDFDLVVASYLLNCAQTQEQLQKICRTICANLKPDGRFVTLNDNVQQPPETYLICERYGFTKSISQPLQEGTPILISILIDGQSVSFTNYHFSKTTYELALQAAGFKTVKWHQPILPAETVERYGQEFWQDFIEYAPAIVIECMG
ncbi:class I SAM-dependent methyltransferase [Phormidium tenue FACHB-886]|nr:class I SAM-dependent methyltransferase [Phormidium tenue FACHB-886]